MMGILESAGKDQKINKKSIFYSREFVKFLHHHHHHLLFLLVELCGAGSSPDCEEGKSPTTRTKRKGIRTRREKSAEPVVSRNQKEKCVDTNEEGEGEGGREEGKMK